jgi:hypothetical protein
MMFSDDGSHMRHHGGPDDQGASRAQKMLRSRRNPFKANTTTSTTEVIGDLIDDQRISHPKVVEVHLSRGGRGDHR